LTQSEKNRLSRDIRPKLKVVEEVAKVKDEFELKKDATAKRKIEKVVDIVLHDELKDKIKAILLFGSHVKGKITKRSDIDICVVFDDIDLKESTKFRIRILGNFSEKIDIQVFNVLPQKVKRSIASNHKVIFKREDFDNTDFTINYLKDDDYFIRMQKIFGEAS
jgi:predicted nucleotidyltransferase